MFDKIDECIRRDLACRGLIGSEPQFGPLCPGDLASAAVSLAESASHVAIVTGFFIPRGEPPAAETDGPPGAVVLAIALLSVGCNVTLITDSHCGSAVRAAARAARVPEESVRILSDDQTARQFLAELTPLSHLIAIERVGPSHTTASLFAHGCSVDVLNEFARLVPPAHQNRCHNMRGEVIDEYTAGTHQLFDELRHVYPAAKTIGIGDGGNELGMGRIPWEDLTRRLSGPHAPWLPCRVATDWTIIAGTSNWGGSALAAALLWQRGRVEVLEWWDADFELSVIRAMVEHGPAVDGVTRQREPTVDGLPFPTYIEPWNDIRKLLGLSTSAPVV